MLEINVTFLVQLGLFLLFMVIVNTMLFRPMRQYLARRQRTIDNLRAGAGGSESEIERIASDYNHRLTEARDDILVCRAAARRESLDKQKEMLEAAKRKAVLDIGAAEDVLKAEVSAARDHLRRESSAIAAAIAVKVFGRTA